jgi:CheY-like chemotaxis protein
MTTPVPADRGPILLIEDHPDTREMFALMLAGAGFDVVTATNGAEGLRQLHATRPSLVLLDLMMPVMTGWEFRRAQQALSDPQLASTPVIVVSAASRLKESTKDLDGCSILQKPVDFDVMLDAVRRCARSA